MQARPRSKNTLPSTSILQNWDNQDNTKYYLITVASCMYATILVTCGLVVHISIPFIGYKPSIYFCIIICCIGMAYHVYLIIDIRRYLSIALKYEPAEKGNEVEQDSGKKMETDEVHDCTPVTGESSDVDKPALALFPRDYCFKHGRHSGSFFLKVGAGVLACGHVIHSTLLFAVQIAQLFDELVNNDDCVVIEQIVLDILLPCYVLLQTYFIFNHSKIVIMKRKNLAHWALMHIIGTSLCFWLEAIVRETLLVLVIYANSMYSSKMITMLPLPPLNYLTNDRKIFNTPAEPRFFNISGFYNAHCAGSTFLVKTQHVSPYLYPFAIEFNTVIAHFNDPCFRIPHPNALRSIKVMFQNIWQPSSQGAITISLVLMIIIAGTLILNSALSKVGGEYAIYGSELCTSTMLSLHLILIVANLMAFNHLKKLDINEHPMSALDDILLFICIPAFALELMLSLMATSNEISFMNDVSMGVQMIVQTLIIMDGLRRCSNTRENQQAQPGKDVIAFLVITNLGMWIHYTFYHAVDEVDERIHFYGKVPWTILGHISLPLIMFYRFHSSICFADIWKSAYRPGMRH